MLRNKKGFTLIELIIVIAILGILTALIVPNYIDARERAKESAFYVNIKRIEQAATMFILDYPNKSAVWSSFAGQKADKTIEITDSNLRDTWNLYFEEYPTDITRGKDSTFTVDISANGDIKISPDEPHKN